MDLKQKKRNLFDELASPNSLSDLGLDRAKIIRTIETLKVNQTEINPVNVALELAVPKSFIYADLELLEYIYRNALNLTGQDKLISELITELKSHKRKITRLKNQLEQIEKANEKSFNEGFSKGASMNFAKPTIVPMNTELWARGVLQLSASMELNEQLIKKSYRSMVSLLHPDVTGKDTSDVMNTLKEACDYLLSLV